MKRPVLQNYRVAVLRMAFRARKVFGTFEKQASGGTGFASHWLKNWIFELTTKHCKHSCFIAFDSQLKTTLNRRIVVQMPRDSPPFK